MTTELSIGPATSIQLDELLSAAGVAPDLAHSDELRDEGRQINADAAGPIDAVRNARANLEADIAAVPVENISEVFAISEQASSERLNAMHQVCDILDRSAQWYKAVAQEWNEITPGIEKQHYDMFSTVRTELERIGQGLAAQPAYPMNQAAAGRQLDGLVRANVRVIPLAEAAYNAKNRAYAAARAAKACEQARTKATAYLRKAALAAAGL